MSVAVFVPGQRWVSNTESELGLGIVVEVANRRVEISFPAAGERRTYAVDNAPVSRVRYEAGQEARNQQGETVTIEAAIENNGCLIYNAVDEQGNQLILPELDLDSFIQFSQPQDRLFAGQIDKNRAFQLRCETLEQLRLQQQSPVRGLLGARLQLLPHQLYIANEAANRYAPRVLLADEVGLGKTIEAGLILHQQLITGRSQRVLVVVPDSLLHQWLVEMLRRFNLFFTILDEDRCVGLEEKGGEDFESPPADDFNPFDSAQLVLCTLSFLTNHSQRQRQAAEAGWDLLIVDEAHHLEWSEAEASPAYQCVERLAANTRGLLLLTATPEQLGIESHFARLRLLDPDRYFDLLRFVEEQQQHQPVNELVQQLTDQASRQSPEPMLLSLQKYLDEATLSPLRDALQNNNPDSLQSTVDDVIQALLDRHGTGRVLFRNTRASVSGFPERQLHRYPLPLPDTLRQRTDTDILKPELLLGDSWITEDPRVDWLCQWLKQHRQEKVLVICAAADTALDLEAYLRLRQGMHSAVFHEGLSLVARDRAAAYFADMEEGAQLLICSEIGSEGRNFQFSHHLVLFDLPLNPDLLEQRIGRLDRIGQLHTVDIHVPFYENSAQQILLEWLHQGINAFESTCPTGLALYKHFQPRLHSCLQNPQDNDAFSALLIDTQRHNADLLEELQQGRDRLLELSSCKPERAEQIVTDMLEQERRQQLTQYMEQVFDQFGVEQEHHSAASVILRAGDHMLQHSFPGLTDEAITATYSREMALSREDMQFLSWEHPMVTGAMDMVLNSDFGNTAFCTLKLPPLKPGTLLLELIYVLRCAAPAGLQLQRYLPTSSLRIVLDSNGNDLSKVLTTAHFEKLAQKVAKHSARSLVNHSREPILAMLAKAEKLANQQSKVVINDAEASMQREQQAELQRLEALAAVNANIRSEEVAYLREKSGQLSAYIQTAQLTLDAVRVAVVTD